MWIEVRKGKLSTKFRCHVEKINSRTGLEVKKAKIFDLRSAAEQWGKDTEYELSRGKFLDTRAIDSQELAQYIQKYIEEITPLEGKAPSKVGWKAEVNRLKVWLNNPLTSRPISKITDIDMLDHIRTRRRTYSKRQKAGGHQYVSEQTIKHEILTLSNVFEFAKLYYKLEGLVNPVRAIPKGLKPGRSREIDVRIPPGDWGRLSALLKQRRNSMYIHVCELAIETAMRQGEIFRLEPKDVHIGDDLQSKFVTATDFRQEGGQVVAYKREIPLASNGVRIIKEVFALRNLMKDDPSPTIWGTISADGLSRAFREDCETLGIRDKSGQPATFHATRHEACSRMANAGIPINKLQKITGHKTMSQLQRYYNPTIHDLSDAFLVMENYPR